MTNLRPKKIVLLAVVGLCLAGASVPTSEMIATAWTIDEGIIQLTVEGFLSTIGVSLASAIAFATAVICVLSLLFIFDSTKTAQGVLFILVLPVFIWILNTNDLWEITWPRYPLGLASGMIIGFGLGLWNSRIKTGASGILPRIREFPSAARGLYWLVVIAVVGGFIQVHIIAGQLQGLPINFLASIVLITSTGVFTNYDDDRNVVVVSPDPAEEANVLGGIYEAARANFGAEPLKTAAERSLDRGRTIMSPSGETEQFGMPVRADAKKNLEPLDGTAGFRFRAPGFLGQTLEIRSNGYSPEELSSKDIEVIAEQTKTADTIFGDLRLEVEQVARQYVPQLLPQKLINQTTSTRMNARNAIMTADTVILIVSESVLPKDLDAGSIASEQDMNQKNSVIETYKKLCANAAESNKNMQIVVTDAHKVGDALETQWKQKLNEVSPERLGRFINGRRLDNAACDVVGVFRITNLETQEPETKLWGASTLLQRLY